MSFCKDLFRKAWAAFRSNWRLAVAATLVASLPTLVCNALIRAGLLSQIWPGVLVALGAVFLALSLVPGLAILWLKFFRGESAELRDLVHGLRYFGKYFLALLLLVLMILGAALVFGIVFVMLGWSAKADGASTITFAFSILLYLCIMGFYGLIVQTTVDQNTTGPVTVLRRSRELLRSYRLRFLGLMLIVMAAPSAVNWLINRIEHPAATIASLVSAIIFPILNNALTCAFYETIRPAGKPEPGLRNRLRKERRTQQET